MFVTTPANRVTADVFWLVFVVFAEIVRAGLKVSLLARPTQRQLIPQERNI